MFTSAVIHPADTDNIPFPATYVMPTDLSPMRVTFGWLRNLVRSEPTTTLQAIVTTRPTSFDLCGLVFQFDPDAVARVAADELTRRAVETCGCGGKATTRGYDQMNDIDYPLCDKCAEGDDEDGAIMTADEESEWGRFDLVG